MTAPYPAGQSRMESLVETCLTTAIGFAVSLGMQYLVFPLFGFVPSLAHSMAIAALFTAASLIRGYLVRRFFARGLHRVAVAVAARVLGRA